jgi:hypothetical protein
LHGRHRDWLRDLGCGDFAKNLTDFSLRISVRMMRCCRAGTSGANVRSLRETRPLFVLVIGIIGGLHTGTVIPIEAGAAGSRSVTWSSWR